MTLEICAIGTASAAEPAAVVKSPVGMLGIHLSADRLAGIDILRGDVTERRSVASLVAPVVAALRHYFRDPRIPFELPLCLSGTAFQQKVWTWLRTIPVGQTVTYGALGQCLSTSARAVGQACRANPIAIIVPCHRVVAAHGLGGFMGAGDAYLDVKSWLIQHETQASGIPKRAVTR